MKKFLLFVFLIIIDLISKKYVYELVDLYTFIPLTVFLEITHIHNFGVSFGLFSGLISPWILIFLAFLVTIFIFYLMLNSSDIIEKLGLLIIISGAISNIIDRSINGYVIDFIYIHYNIFSWPAFNFADIYITIGIIMIIINMLTKIKKK